ncbi:MAG: hypothetical protein U5L03_13705 [Burkholderiaceae bacterium]|nr:hypothetical protein [Burkholderiaceae bacterium]
MQQFDAARDRLVLIEAPGEATHVWEPQGAHRFVSGGDAALRGRASRAWPCARRHRPR